MILEKIAFAVGAGVLIMAIIIYVQASIEVNQVSKLYKEKRESNGF